MCPSAEEWYDFKEGLLSDPKQSEMEIHRVACAACRAVLQDMDKAAKLLKRVAPWADAPTTACPDDPDMAQALTGALSEPEQAALYGHLCACPRCRQKFMTLSALLRAAQSQEAPIPGLRARQDLFDRARTAAGLSPRRPAWSGGLGSILRWRLVPAVAALAVLLAVIFLRPVYVTYQAHKRVEEATQHLIRGIGQTQFSNLRVSGGFSWPKGRTRGALNEQGKDELSQAERELQDALSLRPQDPEVHHAFGRFYLVRRDWNQAERYLKMALSGAPGSAAIHNDLGVLAYERGRASADAPASDRDYAEAADHFAQAMAQDARYAEAVFNAARLNIYRWQKAVKGQRPTPEAPRYASEAKRLVEIYGRLDPDSDWLDDLRMDMRSVKP